jgi:PAS domain-containing protein
MIFTAPQTARLTRRQDDRGSAVEDDLRAALQECVQLAWMRVPAAIVLSTFVMALVRFEYGVEWLSVVLTLEGVGVLVGARRLARGKGLTPLAVALALGISLCWTVHEFLLWRAGGDIALIGAVMDAFTISLYAVLGAHRDLRLMAAMLAPQFAMLCTLLISIILAQAPALFQPLAIAATLGSCAVIAAAGVLMHRTQRRLNRANHDLTGLAQRLELREAFLEEVSNLVLVGGFEYELASGHLSYNSAFLRLFNLDPDAKPAMTDFVRWVDEESRAVMAAAMRAAWSTGEPWDLELPVVTPTGRSILVRTVGRAVFVNRRPARLIGAVTDITQEREVQSALAELATRLRAETRPAQPAAERRAL